MAKPTFVNSYPGGNSSTAAAANWNNANDADTRTTASFNVLAGDVLVVCAMAEDTADTFAAAGPSGGSLTYTSQENVGTTNFCRGQAWTATVDSDKSMTVQLGNDGGTGGRWWGMVVYHFRGSNGIGAAESSTAANSAPSRSISTTQANSAIVYISGDWDALDGTSRTWRTINSITPTSGNGLERAYFRDASHYTVYSAYWDDAGVVGAKTTGLSAPSAQENAMIAIEVKGTSVTNYSITAEAGSYLLTGSDATFRKTHRIITDSALGNYVLIGADAFPERGGRTAAEAASYSLTGSEVTLTKAGGTTLPAFRALSSVTYTARTDSTVLDKPTGTVDGDILLACVFAGKATGDISFADDYIVAAPAGWTQIGDATVVFAGSFGGGIRVWWKRASSEGSTYTFTHDELGSENTTFNTQGVILAYEDCVDSGSPVHVFSQVDENSAPSNTATYTGVTTTETNTKLVLLAHNWDASGTLSPPSGMAERFDSLVYAADQDHTVASGTGDKTQTLASTGAYAGFLVALLPVGAGAGDVNVNALGTFVEAFTNDVTVTAIGNVSITLDPFEAMTASTGDVTVGTDVRIPSLVPINPAAFLPFLVR